MTSNVRTKLIEVGLPLPEINDASAYDKMPGIGPHPKGIHHWWARLPLPTARAVLFASIVDDPSSHPNTWPTEDAQNAERERLFDILRRMMGKRLHDAPEIYAEARKEMLKHCDGNLPPLVDPFAGGGSIPLEGQRLGFEAYAGDLNPVAVLLNKCNLELTPCWVNHPPVNPTDRQKLVSANAWHGTAGLAADIRHYSRSTRERAGNKLAHLYPQVDLPKECGGRRRNVVAWVWIRTVASPNPAAGGKHVPLASSFILASKGNDSTWIEPVRDANVRDGWRLVVHSGRATSDEIERARAGTKAGKGQSFVCLLTGTPIQRRYIQAEGKAGRLGTRLMAIVAEGLGGKVYLDANEEHEKICEPLARDAELQEVRRTLLSGSLPTRAEITGGVCTAYGLNTWGHLFLDRQLAALVALSDTIRDLYRQIEIDALLAGLSPEQAGSYSSTITTFLALAVDRCADFNNSLCRWNSSNQKVMNLFGKQAIPMVFDFAEANLFGTAVGAWDTCSRYVADCVAVFGAGARRTGSATQMDAATEQRGIDRILVSTDPPYYNNISYAVLSDFFYVWLRRSIGHLYPDLFSTLFAPKLPELIAAANRFDGDQMKAKQHFEQGFRSAFANLRSRMDPRFPLTVYYAFKQDDEEAHQENGGHLAPDLTTGWETLLEALISSGFQITATWPMRASQKWRMVSMGANALASYIVLACRPRSDRAPRISSTQFRGELKEKLPAALRHLQQGNIAPVDFAQAAIGPGMAIYSKYEQIVDANGGAVTVRTALGIINQMLTEVLSELEDDFDANTRWAISWFEQNGFSEGDYGEAEVLSKAKVTSVSGLQQAGIVSSRGGKVRLLSPDKLSTDWDPEPGTSTTVWEMTHHLLRLYYFERGGDEATAALLRKIGGGGEVARELAYRLHNISERKKWSQEAQAYNSLVLGWSEIARLAREPPTVPVLQPVML